MSSSTLQFVVAGALVAAWAWMLGRPILTNLFRRSRRDSVGHFRYQQAVLSQQGGPQYRSPHSWADRPRPLLQWRSQPLERRRLQTMLGFAIATFLSLLFAIAVRGMFVRLFLVMGICFLVYLCVAAYIGATQLRRQEEVRSARGLDAEQRTGRALDADVAPVPQSEQITPEPLPEWSGSVLFPEIEEDTSLEEYDEAAAIYDAAFFEPIPELTFEPLNLDASVFDPSKPQPVPLFGEDADRTDNSDFFEQLVGRDNTGEYFAIDEDGWIAEPVAEVRDPFDDVVDVTDADLELDAVDQPMDPIVAEDESSEADRRAATFTAAPVQRQRPPKRNKARPIYIESQLDEGDDQTKAVND